MESQRERTPHVTDTPRCRLSLNDLEQLNAARSESFQPEKLHSPRLSSVSAPVLTLVMLIHWELLISPFMEPPSSNH